MDETSASYDWLTLDEDEEILWAGQPASETMYGAYLVGIPTILLLGLGLLIIASAYLTRENTDYVITTKSVYKKTGIFPFNHTVIIRRSIYEQHPWAARNLLEAFEKAKQQCYADVRTATQPWIDTGVLDPSARKALDTDIFPYGMKANRMVVEKAMEYSTEQGLTPRVMTPEEVYVPELMDS